MEQQNFRNHLQKEYLKKREKNPNFSLRAFAKNLGVDPGSLSQFLNGKRNYGKKKIQSIALQLGYSPNQLNSLLNTEAIKTKPKLVDYDKLHLLSKWYYTAIIECLELDDFEPKPEWIAKHLGISVSIVNIALDQFFSNKILEMNKEGNWINHWENYTTQKNEDVDEMPLRLLQKQFLDLAKVSIDNNPASQKSHTAYIGAIDSNLVPEIKEEIKNFRHKIANLIKEKSKKKDSIYCMQLNLFSPKTIKEIKHDL